MTKAKKHHLVPRVYLRPWCNENDSVYNLDKESKLITPKNINNNYDRLNFHSLKAGMPILTEEDMEKIFEALSNYDVYLGETKLKDLRSLNNNYYEFADWRIEREGKVISRKDKNILKSDIDNKSILDIEKDWNSKYEDRWNGFRDDLLLYRVLKAPNSSIDAVGKGYLMKFIVGMNWRGFSGNEDFNKAYNHIKSIFGLKDIEVPYEDRNKKYLSTVDKEIENDLLLKYYREFLKDEGPIYIMAKEYISLMTIKFYVASERLEFVTSDNPSFIMKDKSGKNVHMMAISPKVLASIGRDIDKSNKYFIEDINDEKVKEINNIIYENAKIDVIMTANTKKQWIKV